MAQASPGSFRLLLAEVRKLIERGFEPGERLPSKRSLAATCGSTPTTIDRVLTALAAEELIYPVPRQGWYRTGQQRSAKASSTLKKLRVGLISRRVQAEWERIEIYSVLLEEARLRGIELVAVPNRYKNRPTRTRNVVDLSLIPWPSFDVGLLVEAEATIAASSQALKEHLVIAVDEDATESGIDSVEFDNVEAGRITARHLFALGHRRFALTNEVNDVGVAADPSWIDRAYGFEKEVARLGGYIMPRWRVPMIRYSLNMQYLVNALLPETVASWLAVPQKQRPTALFAHAPETLDATIDELAKHGLRVPRDFSIVTVIWNGKTWEGREPAKDGLRYTCIDLNLRSLTRKAFELAEELFASKTAGTPATRRIPKLLQAPVSLIEGSTTALATG